MQMKGIFVAICCLAFGVAFADTHSVTAIIDGKSVGQGTVIETASAKGCEHKLNIKISGPNGGVATILQVSYVDSNGKPTKSELQISQGTQSFQTVVTFSGLTAHCTITTGGKSKVLNRTAPKGSVIADKSNFWFKSIHPQMGAAYHILTFDPQSLDWVPTTLTYVKDTDLKIGSTTFHCHKVTQTIQVNSAKYEETIYLDRHGDMVKYITPSLTLQRS